VTSAAMATELDQLGASIPVETTPFALWEPVAGSMYSGWGLVAKRVLDVVVAVVGLLVLIPVILVIAATIRVGSEGPALFVHERLGQGGRPFRMLKFRTMQPDAEEVLHSDPLLHQRYVQNGFKLQTDEDPRVTRVGRFLRKTSLDELPQLWNVLKGDMSLVGPRPIVMDELPRYGQLRGAYLEPRPGLTGRWQVEGRSQVGYPLRAELDADYLRTWNLSADLSLIARTIPTVLTRRGAD
jgi:exopolysaccharide production protein ExoY